MNQVELAQRLARTHHAGQVDKAGRDYYDAHLAPIAELLRPHGERAEALGWLHDIVEDTDLSVDDLISEGVEPDIAYAVGRVSRVPGETYRSLIARSAETRLSALGKLADNTWNVACNLYLALVDPVKADSLLNGRYLPARKKLIPAAGLSDIDVDRMLEQARDLAAQLA